MLITLRKDEYLPVLDQWVDDRDFAVFVEILGQALWHGDHAIHAPPLLLERLSAWRGISASQADALRRMARDVGSGGMPFDAVTDSLVLTGPAGPTPDPATETRWHRRPWQWLSDKERLAATCLGGENENDARWYALLGQAWGARLRPGSSKAGTEVVLRPRGLGGDTAKQEIPTAGAHGDPVLCILDSDRDHPGGSPGKTARAVAKALGSLKADHLVHVEELRARDVENVLPLDLVEEAGHGSEWLSPMKRRGFFARPEVDPALSYLDLDVMACAHRLLAVTDQATKDYRAAGLSAIRARDEHCPQATTPCARVATGFGPCGSDKPGGGHDWSNLPETCIVVHSVGKKLLPKVVGIAEKRTKERGTAHWLADLLPEHDLAVIEPARVAWSWGLGSAPRIRAAPR